MIRRHAKVRGRVQGVWFRESTRRVAERESVAGWVRNAGDGTVEAVFEGEEPAVERLLDFVRLGPPDARVEHVDVYAEEPEGITGFAVR